MKLLKLSERVEYEQLIPKKYNSWGNDAILFRVNKGLGKLAYKHGSDSNDQTYGFLLLDDKPLINSYGDEMFCPTCAKVLSIGLGRENADKHIIETIKLSQDNIENIDDIFNDMKPMLSILDNGYYLLTRIELIPTDGDGNFFWNLANNKRLYKASSDIYYNCHILSGTPKFILPSQGIGCLNEDRVNYYIDNIKSGKNMTGLAYYYDGFMCTLLDGHHRATAAYFENKTIECVTIIKVNGISPDTGGNPDKIYAAGEVYELDIFKNPKRIYKYIEKLFKSRSTQLSTKEVESILSHCQSSTFSNNSANIEIPKRNYPDCMSIGFANVEQDTSVEHIEEVMDCQDEDSQFELEVILKKLILDEPERAFELSKGIIENYNWKVLWEEAFKYLATIDSDIVEQIFVDYLVNIDYDSKDRCRNIADEYLKNR